MGTIPHPIPYQGSKRRLAASILRHLPDRVAVMYEPFAGSAAVTLAAAARRAAERFVLADKLEPLVELWRQMIADPETTAARYERLWRGQAADPRGHYTRVRERFNRTGQPELLLYLLARCVKNAVRFNARGEFNQSADHRRRGVRPDRMRAEITAASALLAGRCEVVRADYADVVDDAGPGDFVYLDPPYQGVSSGPDSRYVEQLDFDRFVAVLGRLRRRRVPFAVSFDGFCGDRVYGRPLPGVLGLRRELLAAGLSSQATLSGRRANTVESLYLG
jgi:DNA adenine methylase